MLDVPETLPPLLLLLPPPPNTEEPADEVDEVPVVEAFRGVDEVSAAF